MTAIGAKAPSTRGQRTVSSPSGAFSRVYRASDFHPLISYWVILLAGRRLKGGRPWGHLASRGRHPPLANFWQILRGCVIRMIRPRW
jgi:hypothetical protein